MHTARKVRLQNEVKARQNWSLLFSTYFTLSSNLKCGSYCYFRLFICKALTDTKIHQSGKKLKAKFFVLLSYTSTESFYGFTNFATILLEGSLFV